MLIKGILSYPHLFVPRAVDANSAPRYSVNVLLPIGDPQLVQIQAEIEQSKLTGFPQGFPPTARVCLVPDDKIQGYMRLSTASSAENKPSVVDMNRQPIIDPSLVFAGAVAYVAVRIRPYTKPQKGIQAALNGVMITGETGALGRIDGRPTVDQMFSAIPAGAPGAAGVPMFGGPPVTAAPPPPAAPAAPAAPVATAPTYIMTPAAKGATREAMLAAGWTDDLLIQHGMMLPPGGAPLPWQK